MSFVQKNTFFNDEYPQYPYWEPDSKTWENKQRGAEEQCDRLLIIINTKKYIKIIYKYFFLNIIDNK